MCRCGPHRHICLCCHCCVIPRLSVCDTLLQSVHLFRREGRQNWSAHFAPPTFPSVTVTSTVSGCAATLGSAITMFIAIGKLPGRGGSGLMSNSARCPCLIFSVDSQILVT